MFGPPTSSDLSRCPSPCARWVIALLCLVGLLAAGEPAAAVVRDYRLAPGDLLRIDVFDNPDLSAQLRVPASGSVNFPLIGDIGALGRRPLSALTDEIRTRLEGRYLRQAVVTATVLEFGPRQVFVLGSVKMPSGIPLNPQETTTAMQAIAQAGGFLDDANRLGARVLRDLAGGEGKLALPLPANDTADDLAGDIALEPGDVIIVPRLDRVYVIGRIIRPGALNLPSQEQLTISRAISLSGGFDKFANQDAVQLMREGRVSTVDVRAILAGKTQDPPLRPGDTVYVQESRF
jgi:polysaccharide export outer membrane protein